MARRTLMTMTMIMTGVACAQVSPAPLDVRAGAVRQPERPPQPEPSTEVAAPDPNGDDPAICPSASERAGFENCRSVEVTGTPPCETICTQTRSATPSDCCVDPVDAVVFAGTRELLRVPACGFVAPECAHVHGHGNRDAVLRVLEGPPVELVVVEGGCEARAVMHGYVPAGVAAWTGCNHERYRWDGSRLVEQ